MGDAQESDAGDEGPSGSFQEPAADASGAQTAGDTPGGLGDGGGAGADTGTGTAGDTTGGGGTAGNTTGGGGTAGDTTGGGGSTWACVNAEDCASPTTQVCSAQTHACVSGECDGQSACAGPGEICVGQIDQATVGACYQGCELSTGCAGQRTCTPLDLAGSGFCEDVGQAAAKDACASTDTTSGCGAGLACVADDASGSGGSFCRSTCDYWGQSAGSGCGAESTCHPLGVCLVSLSPDPTPIGQPCSAGTQAGTWCGTDQGRLGGACDASGTCRALCRTGQSDCAAGASCEDVFSAEIGLCTLEASGGTGGTGGTGGGTTPTWTTDIHAISQKRCTPCHSNWFVDSYSATQFNAGDILGSMKGGWMPPGCPQNASQCANSTERSTFEAWMNAGMPE